MKCHINGMVCLPWIKSVSFMKAEQVMSMFDYQSELIESIVFAYIMENKEVVVDSPYNPFA
jgi:hypothetical protein